MSERDRLADVIEAAMNERFDIGQVADSILAAGFRHAAADIPASRRNPNEGLGYWNPAWGDSSAGEGIQ